MEHYEAQGEVLKAIGKLGIRDLFSRKKSEEGVKRYLEESGKLEEAREYQKTLEEYPVIQLSTEIQVADGYESTSFENVLENYGVSVGRGSKGLPNIYLDKERVGFIYGKSIIPVKGGKEKLGEALGKIVNAGRELNVDTGSFSRALEELPHVEEYDHKEAISIFEEIKKDKELFLKDYILKTLPESRKRKRVDFLPDWVPLNTTYELENFNYDKYFEKLINSYEQNFGPNTPEDVKKEAYVIVKKFENEVPELIQPRIHTFKRNIEQEEKIFRKYFVAGGAALAFGLTATGLYVAFGSNGNNPPDNSPSTQLFSLDPFVFGELNRNISNDTRVTNRTSMINLASQDFLNLGYYGNVSVLNPSLENYRQEALTPQTIQFASNYSVAVHQLGLPQHNKTDVFRVGNMSQNNPDIVDFTPIRIGSNTSYVNIIPNPSRESWSTVQQVKEIAEDGFDIVNHPEMGLGINGKVITNNWCLFDNPYGIQFYSSGITPSSPAVSELTSLQWKLYSKAAPFRGGKVYSDFTWWDSNNLRKNNPDNNELRASLFNLFYMPSISYSIKDKTELRGVEAARTSMLQAAERLETIKTLYPNGKVGIWNEDPRDFYYSEMADRAGWGLGNTIGSFVGTDSATLSQLKTDLEWISRVKNNNGPDGYLTKNWKSYDLAKFIIGYERFSDDAGEGKDIKYITPSVLRMAGFPVNHIGINPIPKNAAGIEYAVGLPQNIARNLQTNFPNKNILLGPGNTISMYSCGDGLKKDGMKEAFVPVGNKHIYLMDLD